LIYATGGAAIATISFSNTFSDFSPNEAGFGKEASAASKTKVGWALGIGVDYAITRNWIANIEFMHVDLGPVRASGTETSEGNTTATLNFSTKLKSDIVRAGIAYKRRVRLKP
jgi:opacity protein-like surface antigen